MAEYEITDQGISVPRVADWIDFMRQSFESDINETVDWDGASKAIGMVIAITATGLGEVAQATQLGFSQNDRNAVKGSSLDNLGSYTLTPRLQATRSLVTLTCAGTNGTAIAAGKQVRDTVTRQVWRSRADAVISGGSVDIEFEAIDLGNISAAPGNVTEIRTAVVGWTSATNAASAIPGRNRETDAQYNARQVGDLARDSANTVLSIRANLLRVGENRDLAVQAVAIIENDLPEPQTVEGVLLPKNSVAVYVYPESVDATYQTDIATILWRHVTSGVFQFGSQTATVLDVSGREKTVRWNWVDPLAVNVSVSAVVQPGVTTADAEARIEAAIAEFFAELNVGEDVSRLKLLGRLADLNKPTSILRSLTLLINSSATADAPVTIVQRAISGTVTVTATT